MKEALGVQRLVPAALPIFAPLRRFAALHLNREMRERETREHLTVTLRLARRGRNKSHNAALFAPTN